ncbi:DegT/DnrJ/EryC1/StrS aminotransferase [hydrothermal vent metagenome]|uniref:DegT/DnrJ/EryC1/StrS aminotransferase n=1 Tax=hydrothermal vent metagenome TaxID=652676 RepID=A0A3B1D652_9ZZZZ
MKEQPAILGGEAVCADGPPKWPLVDLQVQQAMEKAFAKGTWGQYFGEETGLLQEALCQYLGLQEVQLCCSGTIAGELALQGVKVAAGDEVILAAYDFKANFMNITKVGATPVFVDLTSENCQLSTNQLEAAITPQTKAIIVSHLHGGLVAMSQVMKIARKHHISVIEDACQATGAMVEGKPAGTWGNVGFYSFGGSKLLTAGRGGAVFSNQPEIMQRIKIYSHRGNDAYPLTELQAALLLPQLAMLDERNFQRTKSVTLLAQLLDDEPGLNLFQNNLPQSQPAYYKVGMQYDATAFAGLTAEQFARAMRAEGFAIDRGFRALHLVHRRKTFRVAKSLKEANRADQQILVLHHPLLLEDNNILHQLITALKKVRLFAAKIASLD